MTIKDAALCLLLPLAIACLPARAHIHDNYNSVHFSSGCPDFGELPRRCVLETEFDVRSTYNGWGQDDDRYNEMKVELNSETDQLPAERDIRLRAEAKKAERRDDWAGARQVYLRLARANGWSGDLRDRVGVLEEERSQRHPLASSVIRRYFAGLDAIRSSESERWPAGRRIMRTISSDTKSGFLIPHALYQIASIDVLWFDFRESIREYKRLLSEFPRSSKREDTLIMLARSSLLEGTSSGRDLVTGHDALASLLHDYPNTRFRAAATGLLAQIDFLDGRYGNAIDAYIKIGDLSSVETVLKYLPRGERERVYPRLLCGYLQRLGSAANTDSYTRAAKGIRQTIALLSPEGARVFVARLHSDSRLAPPYFYYRLYHCDNSPADVRGLALLAWRLAAAWPESSLPSLIEVRFAEVFYRDGDYDAALHWAKRASTHATLQPFDRATYVIGATLYKMRRVHEARAAFTRLLNECPRSPLRFAAREELALCCEADGDLPSALDQYFLMGYKTDVAFLIDARLTTSQLEAYAASSTSRARRQLLTYTLGIRYLRLELWAEAHAKFERLPPKTYRRFWKPATDGDIGWGGFYDDQPQDPLKTLNDLSRLQRAANRPGISANARASALYHYASYYYKHGTLLLYNYAAWHGDRAFSFDYCWDNAVASNDDIEAARRHMYEHETYARTEALCHRIAASYPLSPTAPYALYRGACSASKLANLNGWWRGELRHHDHFLEASNMMAELARRYPRHPLAADARKFAGVFREDSIAAADERQRWAREEKDENNREHRTEPGWFP